MKLHGSKHTNIQLLYSGHIPLNTPSNIIFYLSVLFAPLLDQSHFVNCVGPMFSQRVKYLRFSFSLSEL